MKTIAVNHATGSYTVSIGDGNLGNARLFEPFAARRALIITDEVVAPLWLDSLRQVLPAAGQLVLPAGESAKTLSTVSGIWEALGEHGFGRDAVLVALGGGVIGDMTGFAAACWMRGIEFVQVPTTLLAQVDASVGGKTGVDLPEGKNLVGAFHQPAAVIIDTATLATLSSRDFSAGFAEIIKAALIGDAELFTWLENNAPALAARDPGLLEQVVARSVDIKARIVVQDEREQGKRALLNLGHTFGHALETIGEYERFRHGEAVAIGLVLAATVSEKTCALDPAVRPRLVALLQQFGLPAALPGDIDSESLVAAMRLDKKHAKSNWRLVLLRSIGDAKVRDFSGATALLKALEAR